MSRTDAAVRANSSSPDRVFGFLLGETLRRVTRMPLTALLRQTLTDPLQIADELHFGVPARLLPRVAGARAR